MNLHDVGELMDYWERYPPSHVLLRAHVGYKPPSRSDRPSADDGSTVGFEGFFSALTGRAPPTT